MNLIIIGGIIAIIAAVGVLIAVYGEQSKKEK